MNGNRFSMAMIPQAQPALSAFVVVPHAVQVGMTLGIEQVYRQAYEQAQAVARPSIIERLSAHLVN